MIALVTSTVSDRFQTRLILAHNSSAPWNAEFNLTVLFLGYETRVAGLMCPDVI